MNITHHYYYYKEGKIYTLKDENGPEKAGNANEMNWFMGS